MRKRMLFLVLALTALAASTTVRADGYVSCPDCTVYPNGSQCCIPCICDAQGNRVACTHLICPPSGGDGRD